LKGEPEGYLSAGASAGITGVTVTMLFTPTLGVLIVVVGVLVTGGMADKEGTRREHRGEGRVTIMIQFYDTMGWGVGGKLEYPLRYGIYYSTNQG